MTSCTCRSVAASTVRHGSSRTLREAGRGRRARPRRAGRPAPPTGPRACRPGSRSRARRDPPVRARRRARPGSIAPRPSSSPSTLRVPDGVQSEPRHTRRPRRRRAHDVGGVAVEPEVRERRPHDRAAAAASRQCRKSASVSAVEWMPTSPSRTHLCRSRKRELVAQRRVDAFGEVVDERAPAFSRGAGLASSCSPVAGSTDWKMR